MVVFINGNVINIIRGRETELAGTINGQFSLPLKPIIDAIGLENNPVIMITDVDSEVELIKEMGSTNIPAPFNMPVAIISKTPVAFGDSKMMDINDILKGSKCNCPDCQEHEAKEQPKAKSETISGRCSLCGTNTELVVVAGGLNICKTCIQIQVGVNKAKEKKPTKPPMPKKGPDAKAP